MKFSSITRVFSGETGDEPVFFIRGKELRARTAIFIINKEIRRLPADFGPGNAGNLTGNKGQYLAPSVTNGMANVSYGKGEHHSKAILA
jgi:hypothetical protein